MVPGSLKTVAAFLVVALATPMIATGVVFGTLIFFPLPATLPNAKPGLESRISHVLDAAGTEIAIFREFETSIPVAQADIPIVLEQAVVAAEDRGFYEHGGVDPRAIVRALWADIRSGDTVQGASTITQQYVRNAYEEIGTERTISRKIREAILAAQLDRQVDKDTILFNYLSTIYFGEGAYGVGAATETYFRKPVSQLTLSEAALLAGVIPAPSRYSPRVDPAIAEQKRLLVLATMLGEGYIDQPTHDAAAAEVIWLAVNGAPPGPATVVQPPLQQQSVQPWFTDYVHAELAAFFGCVDQAVCPQITRGGLIIETTLDPAAQQLAMDEVNRQMEGHDPNLQMAIVSVEPPTGFVRAMVGGRDWAFSQVNTATRGRATGSAFKPFVLATAFASGVQPDETFSGAPHDVTEECGVQAQGALGNYGGERYGTIDLRTATWKSVNTVYTRLILDRRVGVEQTMQTAAALGLAMPGFDPASHCASVALGFLDVTPLAMASAFGTFGNHGRRAPPTSILRVTDASGAVLIDNTAAADRAQQVIPEVVADNVTDVLRGVLVGGGTASDNGIDRPAAGKTGTAEDNGNAWFVGYTPTLATAVWLGYLSCNCELSNINGVRGGITGGSLPAESWERFMRGALDGVPVTDFTQPAPIPSPTDERLRSERGGFGPASERQRDGTPSGGPYVRPAVPPVAELPVFIPAPTTTIPRPTTTSTAPTTTTRPPIIN